VFALAFSFAGLQQLGVPFYVQYLFNGGVLIVAVALSVSTQARRRRAVA
jgi:ribose transport system permease protein